MVLVTPQKVVLSDRLDGSGEEVEIGPFTQGIVIGKHERFASECLIDVATSEVIVVLTTLGYVRAEIGRRPVANAQSMFRKAFIQTYPDGDA